MSDRPGVLADEWLVEEAFRDGDGVEIGIPVVAPEVVGSVFMDSI